MRLSTPLRLAALAVALVTSGAALCQSVPVKGTALAPPPFSIIHAGTLLAVPGTKPVSKATIAVENRNIKIIREGYVDAAALGLPADTPVIDLTDKFVMPGFIDLHVHLSSGAERGRDLNLREPDNYFTVVAYRSATQTLLSGFTTVRDLGSVGYTIFGLRDAIRDGIVTGPRILASGDPISPTDGHADNHNLREELLTAIVRRACAMGRMSARRSCVRRSAVVRMSSRSWPLAAPSMNRMAAPVSNSLTQSSSR